MPGPARPSVRVWLAVALAGVDIGIGAAVLVGWLAGVPRLTTALPDIPALTLNGAVSLVLLGVALVVAVWPSAKPLPARGALVRTALCLVVLAVALATLYEYLAGVSLGIDELVVPEGSVAGMPFPGRPSASLALALAASAAAIVLLGRRWRGYSPSQVLAVFSGAVGSLALLGYLYGAQELTALGSANRMSLLASPALILLAGAIVAADPDHGLVRAFGDPGPAGQMARRVLPAALLVVPIGALLHLEGKAAGLFDEQMGIAFMTIFDAVVLLIVAAWTASRVLRLETERAEIRRDRDRFFELTADLVLVTDLDGRALELSPSWTSTFGRPLQDMLGHPFTDFVHPADRAASAAAFANQIRDGAGLAAFQNRYQCADGSHRWLEWSSRVDGEARRVYAVARDVTERRRADEEAREASRYARGLLEASLDPLVTISPDGTVTDVNEATEQATGQPRAELVGTEFAAYFTEPERARASYQQVLRDGLVRDYPLTIRHASGRTMDVLYNAAVYRDAAGEVQGIFASARDVTEQRRAAASQARLAAIVDSSIDGIFATDALERLTAWNRACEEIFGYPAAEAIGRPAEMIAPEEERSEQARRYEAARAGRPQVYEAFRWRRDGSRFRAQLSTFPMLGPGGAFLGLSTIVRDVTQAYEARERLQATADELARSNMELDRLLNERLALEAERERREAVLREQAGLLELAHDAIFVRDLESRIRFWNAGAERTYGWIAGEAVGRISHELLQTEFPESRQGIDRALVETGAWEGQLRHVTRDGRRIVVESRQVVERDPSGEPAVVLEINRDVTESVSAHARLEESADELRRSNAELEQFAYVASHDLQEPLRMVTGFVGLLQRRYGERLGPEADEYIGYAVEGSHRMQDLINDLLTYSRVGTRGRPFEPVDLGEVVDQALVNLRVAIEEAGAVVQCDRLPVVMADRTQMGQLFQNLIGNAVKFRGAATPEIRVGARRDRRGWRIYVRDNGIGIAPQHQEQIFVIFRRLHARDAYPGSGIGLAICKKIVERHGGRIGVESEAGGGATFWFTLPEGERDG